MLVYEPPLRDDEGANTAEALVLNQLLSYNCRNTRNLNEPYGPIRLIASALETDLARLLPQGLSTEEAVASAKAYGSSSSSGGSGHSQSSRKYNIPNDLNLSDKNSSFGNSGSTGGSSATDYNSFVEKLAETYGQEGFAGYNDQEP